MTAVATDFAFPAVLTDHGAGGQERPAPTLPRAERPSRPGATGVQGTRGQPAVLRINPTKLSAAQLYGSNCPAHSTLRLVRAD